ncbi:hypothetical protein KL86DES1_21765 [uncultured Desulfovibrio sp.]|uniref:Uncharacterized protein n=1 Tax=uncultured Desulfovibrio sp. TaxID=167968 RepID=A0A212L9A0_9BACT|nr:hypothetical protein KL86DES1_21765 [uncultured Desulfovibrio sp.]VZH34666.1 conserved protein of unknown function [Desulfovibrio sp. 86]
MRGGGIASIYLKKLKLLVSDSQVRNFIIACVIGRLKRNGQKSGEDFCLVGRLKQLRT